MIDSEFVIRYTNALYATPAGFAPRYDEFRDMFSSGQIRSKEWAIAELKNLNINNANTVIVGCWFGTLGLMLKNAFPNIFLKLIDIDTRCKFFNEKIFYDIPSIEHYSIDMFDWVYDEDLVVNTSCEHIENLENWLSKIKNNATVLLQSNNFFDGNGHVNCSNSLEEFIEKSKLSNILYSGELIMPMYTRYMIIGTR